MTLSKLQIFSRASRRMCWPRRKVGHAYVFGVPHDESPAVIAADRLRRISDRNQLRKVAITMAAANDRSSTQQNSAIERDTTLFTR